MHRPRRTMRHYTMGIIVCGILPALAAVTSSASVVALAKSSLRPSSFLLAQAQSGAKIEDACTDLEATSAKPAFPRDLMVLEGSWRLVYSSALALPLPPVELPDAVFGALEAFPLAPRHVEQRVDVVNRRVVNVVSLAPWPPPDFLGGLFAALPGPIGGAFETLGRAVVFLELDHAFSVEGEGGSSGGRRVAAAGSAVNLNLESVRRRLLDDTTVAAVGSAGNEEEEPWVDRMNPQVRRQQQLYEQRQTQQRSDVESLFFGLIPTESNYELGPLAAFASGAFETTYADESVRISRGRSGPLSELRIFERIGGGGKKVYETWQEEEDALAAAAAAGEPVPEWDDRWQEGGFEEAEMADFALDDYGEPDS